MGPLDYTSPFANLPSPGDAMMAGIKNGVGITQVQNERAAAEAKQAQAAQLQTDLAALSQNPTTEAIGKMSVKYPHLSEGFKRSFDMLDPAQKQAKLDHAAQVYAALHSGAPDVAQKVLTEQAAALRNSGNEAEAKAAETMATLIKDHPDFAKTTAGLMISSAMGPDKFAESFAKLGGEKRADELHGSAVDKAVADADAAKSDAQTKAITAKYADSKALADLEKSKWDVRKIVEDIEFQKQSNRIAAMKVALDRENNGLKKQELQLKIDEAVTARDDKVRDKTAKAESAIGAMDNMLNTVERVLKNPALNDVLGSIEGRDFYPNTGAAAATTATPYGFFASSGDERADAIALIDTLGSQAFLSQVPTVQGMGSLSNAEGEKLQSALQNLSRKQSEKQFRANMEEVRRIVTKGRDNVSKRYGAPISAPDTPAVRSTRPPLDSFNR